MVCAQSSGVEVGAWHGRDFTTEWQPYSWQLTSPVEKGVNRLQFDFVTGTNRFMVKDLQIIVDGEVVLSDTLEHSLNYNTANASWEFSLGEKSDDVVVKAVCRKDTRADSKGVLTIKNKYKNDEGRRVVSANGGNWSAGDFSTKWDYYTYDFSEFLTDDGRNDYTICRFLVDRTGYGRKRQTCLMQ